MQSLCQVWPLLPRAVFACCGVHPRAGWGGDICVLPVQQRQTLRGPAYQHPLPPFPLQPQPAAAPGQAWWGAGQRGQCSCPTLGFLSLAHLLGGIAEHSSFSFIRSSHSSLSWLLCYHHALSGRFPSSGHYSSCQKLDVKSYKARQALMNLRAQACKNWRKKMVLHTVDARSWTTTTGFGIQPVSPTAKGYTSLLHFIVVVIVFGGVGVERNHIVIQSKNSNLPDGLRFLQVWWSVCWCEMASVLVWDGDQCVGVGWRSVCWCGMVSVLV